MYVSRGNKTHWIFTMTGRLRILRSGEPCESGHAFARLSGNQFFSKNTWGRRSLSTASFLRSRRAQYGLNFLAQGFRLERNRINVKYAVKLFLFCIPRHIGHDSLAIGFPACRNRFRNAGCEIQEDADLFVAGKHQSISGNVTAGRSWLRDCITS